MGKPTICIGENKNADQLRGNREADQRLCFRYSDSTIPPLQGVKKVRRHCNIPYNFIMNNNTISKINTVKTHFNISLHSIIELLQLLF